MIKKRILRSASQQLIYQAALEYGLDCAIESTRFNLFSINLGGEKVFIKGTRLPINSQSSCSIANNKFLSKKIFKQNNICVPKSWLVKTVKQAREVIVKHNVFPCVIKPIYGAHGDEIYANIETLRELDSVLAKFAQSDHNDILIEEHISGIDYRILVVGNEVSAAVERIPAHVVGDGKNSIKALIKKFNAHPLVGKRYEKPLCRIRINYELSRSLKKSGLKLTNIIPLNTVVFLKQNANISSGGTSKDVTATINHQSKILAIKASQVLGMEFSGVDIIFNPKTGTSYVLEVNDCPGIDIHHYPTIGKPQNVAKSIVEYIVACKTQQHTMMNVKPSHTDKLTGSLL